MKLLLSAGVAVAAVITILTLGRFAPLISLLHVGTRCRSTYQKNHHL